jgi:glycosyltransferase involved in cell wall biosynthesis
VASKGTRAVVIPTVVDTERFRPLIKNIGSVAERFEGETPVLGWIGTHSTFPYLESIYPALEELAKTHRFRLKIVGAGKAGIHIPGVEIENLDWKLEREIEDFQSFDIGLYPINAALYADKWAAGKSGFKAIQYMSVGISYVVTPIAASAEIGEPNVTHLFASTNVEWRDQLATLLSDQRLRERMGQAGRSHALAHYTVPMQADKLAAALREAKAG